MSTRPAARQARTPAIASAASAIVSSGPGRPVDSAVAWKTRIRRWGRLNRRRERVYHHLDAADGAHRTNRHRRPLLSYTRSPERRSTIRHDTDGASQRPGSTTYAVSSGVSFRCRRGVNSGCRLTIERRDLTEIIEDRAARGLLHVAHRSWAGRCGGRTTGQPTTTRRRRHEHPGSETRARDAPALVSSPFAGVSVDESGGFGRRRASAPIRTWSSRARAPPPGSRVARTDTDRPTVGACARRDFRGTRVVSLESITACGTLSTSLEK